MERWPLWRGGRCGEVVVVERWPLWRGDHCRKVAASGEAAVVGRWPLWRGGRFWAVYTIPDTFRVDTKIVDIVQPLHFPPFFLLVLAIFPGL